MNGTGSRCVRAFRVQVLARIGHVPVRLCFLPGMPASSPHADEIRKKECLQARISVTAAVEPPILGRLTCSHLPTGLRFAALTSKSERKELSRAHALGRPVDVL